MGKIYVNDTLPAYSSLGGYPIIYAVSWQEGKLWRRKGETVMCARCATRAHVGREVREGRVTKVMGYPHYEGPPFECEANYFDKAEDCLETVESAYGDPEKEERAEG